MGTPLPQNTGAALFSEPAANAGQGRAWVAHQVVSDRSISLTAVARYFNRDESSLRHGVKRYFDEHYRGIPVSRPGTVLFTASGHVSVNAKDDPNLVMREVLKY